MNYRKAIILIVLVISLASLPLVTACTNNSNTTVEAIQSVSAQRIRSDKVTINWITTKSATTQVEYGLDTNYGTATDFDETLRNLHNVLITGLEPDTTYHYRVKSTEGGTDHVSGDFSFTTLK